MNLKFNFSNFAFSDFINIARFFANDKGTCLLLSPENSLEKNFSFLTIFPYKSVTLLQKNLTLKVGQQEKKFVIEQQWEALEKDFFSHLSQNEFAVGWLGYEMAVNADKEYKLSLSESSLPDAYWQCCACVLTFDHQTCKLLIEIEPDSICIDKEHQKKLKNFLTKKNWLEFFQIIDGDQLSSSTHSNSHVYSLQKNDNKQTAYLQKVEKAQDLIRMGEIYQVNLAHAFHFNKISAPFESFHHIFQSNPTCFSAFFFTQECVILSNSPERFLCKKNQRLESRPIKGTIRRGKTENEDKELKAILLNSEKEKAELLMITDLMRNDLNRVSQIGTVKTEALWHCETYTNVHHLVSIISSLALIHLKTLDIIRACFPGGSITGCPKLRAMEIIQELEEAPRGIYTGSIGYIKGNGDFDLNIAIRTLVVTDQSTLFLGSGIVYDSKPLEEYQETLVKGETFFNLLKGNHVN